MNRFLAALSLTLASVLIPTIAHAEYSTDPDSQPNHHVEADQLLLIDYRANVGDAFLVKRSISNPMYVQSTALGYCQDRAYGLSTKSFIEKNFRILRNDTGASSEILQKHLTAIISSAIKNYCPVYKDF